MMSCQDRLGTNIREMERNGAAVFLLPRPAHALRLLRARSAAAGGVHGVGDAKLLRGGHADRFKQLSAQNACCPQLFLRLSRACLGKMVI